MLSYNIVAPQYSHMFGGIRALYQLEKEIKNRGYPATINSLDSQSIAIYPEIFKDNPLNADRRVRWLLNEANFEGEVCYAWESEMGDHPLLTVNIIEMKLWKKAKKRSKKVAYWVGKGIADPSVIPDGAIEINRTNFPAREYLAKFICQLDYLISFDVFSAINIEATVAGVPVLIHVPEKQIVPSLGQYIDQTWSRERIEKQGWAKYGIAWGQDELEQARESVYLQRNHYLELIKVFDQRVDDFIEETQKLFS